MIGGIAKIIVVTKAPGCAPGGCEFGRVKERAF